MASLLVLLAFLVFLLSLIGLIRPQWIRLPTRKAALYLAIASLVAFGIGGSFLPPVENADSPQSIAADRPVEDNSKEGGDYHDAATKAQVIKQLREAGLDENGDPLPKEQADMPEYRIVKNETMPPFKRSIEVELMSKATRAQIEIMAPELKALDKREFENTFIGYWLTGHDRSNGYWATSHYQPELQVQMLGDMLEEAQGAN